MFVFNQFVVFLNFLKIAKYLMRMLHVDNFVGIYYVVQDQFVAGIVIVIVTVFVVINAFEKANLPLVFCQHKKEIMNDLYIV
jgi:hypothetical protein